MTDGISIKVALAGNPNSGKTTIFNNITGAKQHVGNYPGVTVERKEGNLRYSGQDLLFIDLPGTYSLTARSLDELVARTTIINEQPDVIVNVLDASNLERNLYLAAQLIELGRPVVLALNMVDVAASMGVTIDVRKLSDALGAKVVELVGYKNKGTDQLVKAVCEIASKNHKANVEVNYGETLEPQIRKLTAIIEARPAIKYPTRWLAIKLLEHDEDVVKSIMAIEGTEVLIVMAKNMRELLKNKVDLDICFAEYRHQFATTVYNESLIAAPSMKIENFSDRIDAVLTHRVWGIPIFLVIMWALFNGVFTLGAYPQDLLSSGFDALGAWLTPILGDGPLQSLVVDGIIGGVGSVLSFLPLILLLFLGIGFLEDSGYMARAAFLIDRVMRAVGLHGKSFIPLLLGFGCTVPAVMGARILDSPKDRMVTILVAPFMSCGARLPVYTLLIGAFFTEQWAGTVLFGVYTMGIVVAIVMAMIFRHFMFAGETEPFVMEMPPYHMPTLRNVAMQMWERAALYFKKAGTLILGASILVWFMMSYPMDVTYSKDYDGLKEQIESTFEQESSALLAPLGIISIDDDPALAAAVASLAAEIDDSDDELTAKDNADKVEMKSGKNDAENIDTQLYPIASAYVALQGKVDDAKDGLIKEQHAEKLSQSYAASFGHFFEPVLQPLGYDWRIGVALVAATAAKEVMVSTLGTIYSIEASKEDDSSLKELLAADGSYNPAMALSLITFTLLYSPCLAALSVIKRETNSWKWMGFVFAYTCILAWFGAFAVYHIALLMGLGSVA